MVCEEKVTELQRKIGIISKPEYDSLYRLTEALHAEVTKAQGELNSHIVAHRC
jgi:hypothetical protein